MNCNDIVWRINAMIKILGEEIILLLLKFVQDDELVLNTLYNYN